MKEYFLTDGNKSITRLIFFIDILSCVLISLIALVLNRDIMDTAALVGALLAPVSVAKYMQSKYEEGESK